MSENLRRFQIALFGFDAVVRRVTPEQWDLPSACDGWSCREVVGHTVFTVRSVAARAEEGEAPTPAPEAEIAGDDPTATWIETRDRVLAALDRPGALQVEFAGPFGPSTVDGSLLLSAADVYTHSWDIGSAVGIDPALDPSVAEVALPFVQSFGEGARRPGVFGPEVTIAGDAPITDRYLAYTGRKP